MHYAIDIQKLPSGKFRAGCPDLGAFSEEEFSSEADALKFMADGVPAMMQMIRLNWKPVPMPKTEGDYAITIPLRLQAKILLWNLMMEKNLRLKDLAETTDRPAQLASRLIDFTKDKASVEAIEDAVEKLGGEFTLSAKNPD